jgi:hypothetical protein
MSSIDSLLRGASTVTQSFRDINSVGSAVTALKGVTNLFSSSGVITLGEFEFTDYEVPERANFGSKQMTGTHKLPGGRRVFDLLGPDPDPITWSGLLLGTDAEARARELRRMCDSGEVVGLIIGEDRWDVLVSEVSFEAIRVGYHYQYKISCMIVDAVPDSGEVGFLGELSQDISSALGIDLPSTLSDVRDAVSTVRSVATTAVSLTGGSPAALRVLGAVNTAQGLVSGLTRTANGEVAGLAQIAGSMTNSATAIRVVNGLTNGTQRLSALGRTSAYLGSAASRLGGEQ